MPAAAVVVNRNCRHIIIITMIILVIAAASKRDRKTGGLKQAAAGHSYSSFKVEEAMFWNLSSFVSCRKMQYDGRLVPFNLVLGDTSNLNKSASYGKYFPRWQTSSLSGSAFHPNPQRKLSSPPSSWKWLILRRAARLK